MKNTMATEKMKEREVWKKKNCCADHKEEGQENDVSVQCVRGVSKVKIKLTFQRVSMMGLEHFTVRKERWNSKESTRNFSLLSLMTLILIQFRCF